MRAGGAWQEAAMRVEMDPERGPLRVDIGRFLGYLGHV
jgi:hypothetical protein